jgi:hypothetical protein
VYDELLGRPARIARGRLLEEVAAHAAGLPGHQPLGRRLAERRRAPEVARRADRALRPVGAHQHDVAGLELLAGLTQPCGGRLERVRLDDRALVDRGEIQDDSGSDDAVQVDRIDRLAVFDDVQRRLHVRTGMAAQERLR